MKSAMPELISIDNVDIYQLPTVDNQQKGAQFTMGDLHGNAIKLLFMLVKQGIATHISEKDYHKLVKIYCTPTEELSTMVLAEFNAILAKIDFCCDYRIRLLGDELADRGSNDYFTLKILEKLSIYHVPIEIMVSNHGIEFIEAYETQDSFHRIMLSDELAASMQNLQTLITAGRVTRQEILAIANKAYKSMLRVISYTLSANMQEITIFSHAPIGLNTIKSLAQQQGVAYNDKTAVELAQTIDTLNRQFQKHVQDNTVHTLYQFNHMRDGYAGYLSCDAPFEFIMWNRQYDILERPVSQGGYQLNFVHGHDPQEKTRDNIYNLDNQLGKGRGQHIGNYTVIGEVH